MWERIFGWASSWVTSSVKRNILMVACFVVGVYFLADSYKPAERGGIRASLGGPDYIGASVTPSAASVGVGFIVCGLLLWRRRNKDK